MANGLYRLRAQIDFDSPGGLVELGSVPANGLVIGIYLRMTEVFDGGVDDEIKFDSHDGDTTSGPWTNRADLVLATDLAIDGLGYASTAALWSDEMMTWRVGYTADPGPATAGSAIAVVTYVLDDN